MQRVSLQKNSYLLKIGAKSFGDGSWEICKDTESNLGQVAVVMFMCSRY